ncbi:MAG: hypothetical protein J0I86_13215 [Mesorhizobium sp.]|jgi:hypothetical protein|nr:hypothetical protein [Mesorhizobium sp.]
MAIAVILALALVAFVAAGISVGFIQTLICAALVASAAMLTTLVAVSMTRAGH